MNEPRKVPPPPRPPPIGGSPKIEQLVVTYDLNARGECPDSVNKFLTEGWRVVNMISPHRSGTHDHDGIVIFLLERGR